MQVWIGFKQNEEYVHEWTGDVAGESDVGEAIGIPCGLSAQERQGHGGCPSWSTKPDRSERRCAPGAVPVAL